MEIKIKNPIEVHRNSNRMAVPEAEIMPFLYHNFLLDDDSITKYLSTETLAQWVKNICFLVNEISNLKRLWNAAKAGIAIAQSGNRANILTHIYDVILASEGLSTLRGFGLANVEINDGSRKIKRNFMINPERTSIRTKA